jgi:hypothetical protein
MAKDRQGLPLAGATESAAALDRAVADYWGLTGDPVGVLKSALAVDPSFALGAIAVADRLLTGGFRGDHPEVTNALAAAEAAHRALDAYRRLGAGDYSAAIDALSSARSEAIRIGGSHAQRDIVAQTLIAATERSGRRRLARALRAERAAIRPSLRVKEAYERARANAA